MLIVTFMNTREKGTRTFGFITTLLSVPLVLFLTLYPFTFGVHNVHQPHRLAGVGAVLAYDVIGNLLLFVPVGLGVAAWAWGEGTRGWPVFVLVQCFGTLLSLGVENLQVFLPRQPSVVDVFTNSAGILLGYAAFMLWTRTGGSPSATVDARVDPTDATGEVNSSGELPLDPGAERRAGPLEESV